MYKIIAAMCEDGCTIGDGLVAFAAAVVIAAALKAASEM